MLAGTGEMIMVNLVTTFIVYVTFLLLLLKLSDFYTMLGSY